MSPKLQPKMAEPKAEKRGTLRGPPLFRHTGDGRKGHRSPTRALVLFAPTSHQADVRNLLARTTTTGMCAEALTAAPLMAVGTKERGTHDTYEPQRTRNLHPCKTPGQRVHGWPGGIHDGTTNSRNPIHDQDAKRSAEATKYQFKGFMVPERGVHGGDRVAIISGSAPDELTAPRSAVRFPAPSSQRTWGAPTAAARRPERRTLLGIADPPPCLTWWGSYSVTSLRQKSPAVTGTSCPCPCRRGAMDLSHSDRIPGKDREPVGLTVSSAGATIMKVVARHETESKIDVQYYWTWRRCRWPTHWARPRALLEVAALGEKA
jgi:hypothetical protein